MQTFDVQLAIYLLDPDLPFQVSFSFSPLSSLLTFQFTSCPSILVSAKHRYNNTCIPRYVKQQSINLETPLVTHTVAYPSLSIAPLSALRES